MGIKNNLQEIFKSEAQRGKERQEEREYKLYQSKRVLEKEIKRLEQEKKDLVKDYKKLKPNTKEYDDKVRAFGDANNSLTKCKDGLAIISKTQRDLIRGARNKSGESVNVGDTVDNAMKLILEAVSDEKAEAGVMDDDERERTMYGIGKQYDKRQSGEDSLENWKEVSRTHASAEEGYENDEENEESIVEMDAMAAEMENDAKARRKSGLNKEIEAELDRVRADRKNLESNDNE